MILQEKSCWKFHLLLILGTFPLSWSDVWRAPSFLPFPNKLVFQDLCSSFPRQSSFFETQFAHLHIIPSGNEQNRHAVRMQLHLSRNPLTVEVRVPISSLIGSHIATVRGRLSERYPEESLNTRCRSIVRLLPQDWFSCCISHLCNIQNDKV